MKFIKGARTWRSILGTQTFFWPLPPPPPRYSINQPLSKGLMRRQGLSGCVPFAQDHTHWAVALQLGLWGSSNVLSVIWSSMGMSPGVKAQSPGIQWRLGGTLPGVALLGGGGGLCLKGGGCPPPLATLLLQLYPKARPQPLYPHPRFSNRQWLPPPTDFTLRPNRFVTALSWPPERPCLQAHPWGGGW